MLTNDIMELCSNRQCLRASGRLGLRRQLFEQSVELFETFGVASRQTQRVDHRTAAAKSDDGVLGRRNELFKTTDCRNIVSFEGRLPTSEIRDLLPLEGIEFRGVGLQRVYFRDELRMVRPLYGLGMGQALFNAVGGKRRQHEYEQRDRAADKDRT